MPQMIATDDIEYPPGKFWKPGDKFEVEEEHVNLLTTIGRAKLPEPETDTDAEEDACVSHSLGLADEVIGTLHAKRTRRKGQ